MSEFDRALAEIGAMRRQLARAERCRAYGPAAVGATGVVAAAVTTAQWIAGAPDPRAFLAVWIAAAVASVAIVGIEAATRSRRERSRLADAVLLAAAADFAPAGAAGVAVWLVLARGEPGLLWMLPGLWQLLVGLGYLAASRTLPRPLALAGAFYLAAGTAVLAAGSAGHALAPAMMGVPFTLGQLLAAALLRRTLGAADVA